MLLQETLKMENVVGHRGLMVMAMDCGDKGPGFMSHLRSLFLGKFSKKKRKKQRKKMLWQILLLEEKENKDKWI